MRLQLDSSSLPAEGATVHPSKDAQPASQTGAVDSGGRASAPAGKSGDRTLISSPAGIIAASAAQHSARIAQLTAAVQGGTYAPSSAAISHAIVTSLGGSGGGKGGGKP